MTLHVTDLAPINKFTVKNLINKRHLVIVAVVTKNNKTTFVWFVFGYICWNWTFPYCTITGINWFIFELLYCIQRPEFTFSFYIDEAQNSASRFSLKLTHIYLNDFKVAVCWKCWMRATCWQLRLDNSQVGFINKLNRQFFPYI